jgi:ABC-2 type transport system permease protein
LFLSFMVPFGVVMLMFMMIMSGASPLMSSVIEEKMQRIAEVLLSSATPFQIMMGKLAGMVGVALTLTAVYLGGVYWAGQHYGFADAVPPSILAWFIGYLALAVLMYGSIFIAIGAACSDLKEAQAMMGPVMVLLCLPLFVMMQVLREPDSGFAVVLSLIPMATPMLMTSRMALLPNLPLWQPLAGIAIVLLATLVFVYAAARIFRVGLLMHGKGANLKTLFKWIFAG